MTKSAATSQLDRLLDVIWRSPDGRAATALRLAADLPIGSRLALAAWDAAAAFVPSVGQIRLTPPAAFSITDGASNTVLAAEVASSGDQSKGTPLLWYLDTSWAIFAGSEQRGVSSRRMHSFASLLLAMQLIRDHLDSALLKPQQFRERELDDLASQAGVDPTHFRQLAIWYPRIQTVVQNTTVNDADRN